MQLRISFFCVFIGSWFILGVFYSWWSISKSAFFWTAVSAWHAASCINQEHGEHWCAQHPALLRQHSWKWRECSAEVQRGKQRAWLYILTFELRWRLFLISECRALQPSCSLNEVCHFSWSLPISVSGAFLIMWIFKVTLKLFRSQVESKWKYNFDFPLRSAF